MTSQATLDRAEQRRSQESPPVALPERIVPPWSIEDGIREHICRRAFSRCEYYGHGKVALRDALDALERASAGPKPTNVILPAYVPSALVEPIKEAGHDPRFYRVSRELRPNLEDIERQVDDESLAILTVNYFGFSQPDHDEVRAIASSNDVALVEDNAHAALSATPEGRLLGTRGDLGFTSFRKSIPVPDGAVLFVSREDLVVGSFPRARVRSRLSTADAILLGKKALHRLSHSSALLEQFSDSRRPRPTLREGLDLYGRDPAAIYERSKGSMSHVSALLLDHLRPDTIVSSKRHNFRSRHRAIEDVAGVTPIFESLPMGTCPQVFPIVVEEWPPLCSALGVSRDELARWPPLPHEVASHARFDTSRYLAEHLVTLPV